MQFKDLKPGERFFFDDSVDDGRDSEGILFYTKLRKAVIGQELVVQLSKGVSENKAKESLDFLCRLPSYTAVAGDGELVLVPENAEVIKLHHYMPH